MSEAGKAKDACASRAKPRPEGRVCERGWRPTRKHRMYLNRLWRGHRRARRRAIAGGRQRDASRPTDRAEADA